MSPKALKAAPTPLRWRSVPIAMDDTSLADEPAGLTGRRKLTLCCKVV